MSYFTGIVGLTSSDVTDLIARNKPDGTAGIYACKTLLNEHRPVCTKELHIMGQSLGVSAFIDSDNWSIIDGGGAHTYAAKKLTLKTTPSVACATRAVHPVPASISSNFMEVTVSIDSFTPADAGSIVIGFFNSGTGDYTTQRSIFRIKPDGHTYIYTAGASAQTEHALASLPLGRDLLSDDIVTVRLDRVEGSSNIDIVRFYVNGQKQYESLVIPTANCYAGIGCYTPDTSLTLSSLAINYFGYRRVR